MGKSPILQMDELSQGMVQAFQAANNNYVALEDSQNRSFVVDGSDPLNLELLELDILRYFVFRVQGLTADDTLIIPHEVDLVTPITTMRVLVVRNETDYNLGVETDGTPVNTITIPPGGVRLIHVDDQTIYVLAEGVAVTGVPHTVGVYSFGTPGASDVMLRYNFVEPVDYLANFEGSIGTVGTSPTLATMETGQIVFSAVADIGDTVTIYDGQKTTVFTFATSGDSGTGAAVQVARGASATDSGNNLRTAINANTNINVTAGGATTTVSLTNKVPFAGSITKSDADNDYAVTDFSGLDVFEMDIQINAVSIGKAAVDDLDVVWFQTAGPNAVQAAAIGDVMEVIAPATPDATIAGISFTLKGAR